MFTYETITYRLLVACLCGALIGIERERHGRAAGLRTHFMVALGSATIMIMSLMILDLHKASANSSILRIDPGRIAAQVITGIGFLGAGAIIHTKRLISGLTTAACLWVAASIGLAAGMGHFFLAGMATVLSLFSLYLLKGFEHLIPKDRYHTIELTCHYHPQLLEVIENMMAAHQIKIISFGYSHDMENNLLVVTIEIRLTQTRLPQGLLDQLHEDNHILKVVWQ
ncbi:MAG: MgtC/SapB family protein [Deltaproteobacteria bacterium]|nr:MgtC/SapB family protein [Candidatus Anaeroferrophillus wilburensis]MBN2887874.1 MgtC/SapB family protein [Deltaproteobacteria bacterium]